MHRHRQRQRQCKDHLRRRYLRHICRLYHLQHLHQTPLAVASVSLPPSTVTDSDSSSTKTISTTVTSVGSTTSHWHLRQKPLAVASVSLPPSSQTATAAVQRLSPLPSPLSPSSPPPPHTGTSVTHLWQSPSKYLCSYLDARGTIYVI